MSYGADYVTADPANAPLDPPLLVGADPVLWLALGLLLLGAGLFGWWLGARARSHEGDASAAIWKAIDVAAKDAMKADDHALRGRAEALAETVERRLGRTLAVATSGEDGGLVARVAALRFAVAGNAAGDEHAPGHASGHVHEHGDDHAPHEHIGEAAGASPADAPGGRAGAAAVASSITINVAGGAAHGKAPHHPPRRGMTAREQTDALRLAVAAFNEHWRHEARRAGELRAGLAELAGRRDEGAPGSHP